MRLILIFILLSVAALTAQELEEYTLFGMLQTAQLSEISGIERSAQSDTVLWGINDSGNAPNLYAFSKTGVQRSFTIEHAENRDWEDLSAFRRKGQSFLIIADIGDNRAVRDHCVLYIIKEPDLRSSSDEITLQQKIYYQYPDGPRDAEGFAVNPQTRSILICSKRTIPPAIYRLPLDLSSDSLYTAEKIADLTSIPRPQDSQALIDRYQWQPTAMDIDSRSETCCILTYSYLLVYRKNSSESWEQAVQRAPAIRQLPLMQQAESLCFSDNGQNLFVTSEKTPAPVFRISTP